MVVEQSEKRKTKGEGTRKKEQVTAAHKFRLVKGGLS